MKLSLAMASVVVRRKAYPQFVQAVQSMQDFNSVFMSSILSLVRNGLGLNRRYIQ
jgi:hypothetical protein